MHIPKRMSLAAISVASLMCGSAEAATTYQWSVTNNFDLFGNPVVLYENSTCTSMLNCPTSPTTIGYGETALFTAQTNGPNPSAEIYIGYKGNNQNECGFSIAGGTASSNGSSTAPNTFAYILKYSLAGSQIQPGCKTVHIKANKITCDARNLNCIYRGDFTIETHN